nr:MAG TPA: hypothetical protein [Caudoviricetes sp.]
MKHKIIITMSDILNAEHWEQPIHLAAKKGFPVKYANVFDLKSVDIDWDKVENICMWEDKMNNELIFEWKEI